MISHLRSCKGGTTAETLMLTPLYFLLVFGLLQCGQLATALIVANYAASSIAQDAVKDNSLSGSQYEAKFKGLMAVGMKNGHVFITGEEGLLQNIKVETCAELTAFPFIGAILGKAITEGMGGPRSSSDCQGLRTFGFNNALPAFFVVHGEAKARMNYKP